MLVIFCLVDCIHEANLHFVPVASVRVFRSTLALLPAPHTKSAVALACPRLKALQLMPGLGVVGEFQRLIRVLAREELVPLESERSDLKVVSRSWRRLPYVK